MRTSSAAITRYSVSDFRRVAHPAPNQAPRSDPASRLTITGQCWATNDSGTAPARRGRAEATTTQTYRLVQDDRLQSDEPKQSDQQRQPKLCAAKAD